MHLNYCRGIARMYNSEQRDVAFYRIDVFRRWFNREILKPHVQNTIIMLPIEKLEARYREDAGNWIPLTPPSGLNVLFLSPALEAPEIVVPSMSDVYKIEKSADGPL